jgi:hypothetical protein
MLFLGRTFLIKAKDFKRLEEEQPNAEGSATTALDFTTWQWSD